MGVWENFLEGRSNICLVLNQESLVGIRPGRYSGGGLGRPCRPALGPGVQPAETLAEHRNLGQRV